MTAKDIEYSEKYCDDYFEYRHVILPKEMKVKVSDKLLSEQEWRSIGVTQSRGWVHYMIHKPEPHILLFRRPVNTSGRTGLAPRGWIPPDGLRDNEIDKWFSSKQKIQYLRRQKDLSLMRATANANGNVNANANKEAEYNSENISSNINHK